MMPRCMIAMTSSKSWDSSMLIMKKVNAKVFMRMMPSFSQNGLLPIIKLQLKIAITTPSTMNYSLKQKKTKLQWEVTIMQMSGSSQSQKLP